MFRRSKRPALPPLRAWDGDAVALSAVKDLVAAGAFDRAHQIIAEVSLADRFEIIEAVADDVPYAWALDYSRDHPEDAVALVLAGVAAMHSGWRVRTNEDAEHVSADQFKSFWVWLEESEEHLSRAAHAAPSDPTPLVYLLTTGRGLQRTRQEIDQVFQELLRRAPDQLEGHRQRMQFVCDKWFGSHEEMFAFARDVSDRAAPESPLHELLIFAHFERYVAFEGTASAHQLQAYFRQPGVRADLELATLRLGGLLAGPPDGRSITARNLLAFVAWACRDREAFEVALRHTGGVISPMPWNYYTQPLQAVSQAWEALNR